MLITHDASMAAVLFLSLLCLSGATCAHGPGVITDSANLRAGLKTGLKMIELRGEIVKRLWAGSLARNHELDDLHIATSMMQKQLALQCGFKMQSIYTETILVWGPASQQ